MKNLKDRTNSKVDFFFNKENKWQQEFKKLRLVILQSELTEELKWGHPCYTLNNKNVVLIHGFNEYCALLFHKGALLKDPKSILIQQTENVQAARQIRFTKLQEIADTEATLKDYINEAIEVEKAGLKVKFKETKEFNIPQEFKKALDEDHLLREAFEGLTAGRQKGYLLYFSQPKQSKTRESRIEKCIPRILDGYGLNDR